MKFIRISLLCALCAVLIACSSDNNPADDGGDNNSSTPSTSVSQVRFTLSGPDMPARVVEPKNTFFSAIYQYEESENWSTATLIGSDIVLTVGFPGASPGTYDLGEGGSFVGIQINREDGSALPLSSASGTMTVLEANPTSGRLRATFSGSFSSFLTSYTISNGAVSIIRK